MTDRIPPIPMQWDGEAMRPVSLRFSRLADKHYAIGEIYQMVVEHGRSGTSHRHQFAWLHEAWMSLPESIADAYPTSEHLRKRALIDAGFFHETAVDAGSRAAALRVAAMVPTLDEFALAKTEGPFVLVRRPKSQSIRAMGAQQFQESKTAIMQVIADLIGVSTADLQRTGEAA